MSVHAFVSLKQPDLHAISALAALKGMLPEKAVPLALFRCRHVVFASLDGAEISSEVLAAALEKRFDLINPNKERIGWDTPPAVTVQEGYHTFWVDILPKVSAPGETITLADRPVRMDVRIAWGIVWSLDKQALVETLLQGNGPAIGLLVNPVLETPAFL